MVNKLLELLLQHSHLLLKLFLDAAVLVLKGFELLLELSGVVVLDSLLLSHLLDLAKLLLVVVP